MDLDSQFAQSDRFTPTSLFNLIVKAIGLYWLTGGAMNASEILYALYLDRFTAYGAEANEQTITWGIAMVAVGAWMIAYSRWITKVSFAFDTTPDAPSKDTDAQF
ncbi:MAG: hypothetical protein MUC43_04110 [Pirellula sp.]|jgi:hypothetical protein|nr:hypothetical protein [Pirellula sp.]